MAVILKFAQQGEGRIEDEVAGTRAAARAGRGGIEGRGRWRRQVKELKQAGG